MAIPHPQQYLSVSDACVTCALFYEVVRRELQRRFLALNSKVLFLLPAYVSWWFFDVLTADDVTYKPDCNICLPTVFAPILSKGKTALPMPAKIPPMP